MRLAFGWYPKKCPRDPSQCPGCEYGITCPACGGDDEECERCEGEGWVEITRCARESGISRSVFRCLALARNGTWPAPGGSLAQCHSFMNALEIVNDEWANMEDARREEAAREARRKAK